MVNEDAEKFMPVCTILEERDLGRRFGNNLGPISRPGLEQDLISMLRIHKEAIALPDDTLGKTSLLKHQLRLKPGTNSVDVPAYRLLHSKRQVVYKLID